MDRHARQRRLAEVGAAGQGRIGCLTVDLGLDGLAADVAARYLAGAGVRGIRVRDGALAEGARALAPAVRVEVDPSLSVELPPAGLGFADPFAGAAAWGALVALRALRAALAEEAQ